VDVGASGLLRPARHSKEPVAGPGSRLFIARCRSGTARLGRRRIRWNATIAQRQAARPHKGLAELHTRRDLAIDHGPLSRNDRVGLNLIARRRGGGPTRSARWSPESQVDILEDLEPERAADILEEMDPDEAADLVADLSDESRVEILGLMEKEEADEVQELMTYAEDTAGGIMTDRIRRRAGQPYRRRDDRPPARARARRREPSTTSTSPTTTRSSSECCRCGT